MDMKTVAILTKHGVWHEVTQDQESGELLSREACNLDDATGLELYPDLPDWVKGAELCKRCYPTRTDR